MESAEVHSEGASDTPTEAGAPTRPHEDMRESSSKPANALAKRGSPRLEVAVQDGVGPLQVQVVHAPAQSAHVRDSTCYYNKNHRGFRRYSL